MPVKKGGFTIIEVILASVILIISLIGGIFFISANRKNLAYATRQRLATWAAIDKMEEWKSLGYSNLGVNRIIVEPPPALTISGYPFQRRTTIEDGPDGAGYKKVTVEVGWEAGKFPVSLTTYISDREP